MIGKTLGPYEILSSIGSGGMGEVWKARDSRLGRIVAIKKVREQHSERFKQEARSIAALNHPNICQIFDIGDDYLVLEYIEGKPLSSPLPEQEAVKLAIQIATALEAAHRKGIIHRDLKPGNILVTDEGSVKLLDFGLAKLYEHDVSISNLPTEEFPATQAGAILGTVAYMSPEQAQGQTADARSDIFSFGLVLYEMLSGRRAFSGDSSLTLMNAIVKDDPPHLQTSPRFEKIVKRCLEKNPPDRYQTMTELKAVLEKVTAKQMSSASEEDRPSIAVLPFVNMSGDREQEYFSDGLAEEILNALTKIPGLKVIARTSAFAFKGRNEDIRKIAEILGVENVLEGSVRKAGDRVRITAQLIIASDGSHLWSERYDRDLTDIFAVQDEISESIAMSLRVKLAGMPADQKNYEPNLEAHEAYLKARYHFGKMNPDSLKLSREYFEKAIELDSRYALAYCGLAEHFLQLTAYVEQMPSREAMPVIRQQALNALDKDPALSDAHALLGIVACAYDYDWKEAGRRFQLALSSGPASPHVRHWYGYFYLLPTGRIDESIEVQEQVLKEDPLDLMATVCLSGTYLYAGKLEEAKEQARRILEFDGNNAWAAVILAHVFVRQDRWIEAVRAAEKGFPMIPYLTGVLGGLYKKTGELEKAEQLRQKLLREYGFGSSLGLSSFYHLSGEIDKAVEWYEKGIEGRHPLSLVTGRLGLMHESSRWPAIAKLMKLPIKEP